VERVEEYLEAIYDVQSKKMRAVKTTDLAKKLSVRPSSVTEMLSKLSNRGYIEYRPYKGAVLTKKGEEIARRIKRYHHIFEEFFSKFLGLEESKAHKLSCELEHHVNDEIARKVCEIIASSCTICESCEFSVIKLSDAKPGRYVVVVCPASAELAGIAPDRDIVVKDGGRIEVDGELIKISEKLARRIILEKTD